MYSTNVFRALFQRPLDRESQKSLAASEPNDGNRPEVKAPDPGNGRLKTKHKENIYSFPKHALFAIRILSRIKFEVHNDTLQNDY